MHNIKTKGEKAFDVFNYIFFGILSLIMIYPIWHQLCLSFSDANLAKTGGFFFWPRGFTLTGYSIVLTSRYIWVAFLNSVLITVSAVLLSVLFCSAFAFLLSKRNVPGSRLLMFMVLFSFLFTGGMIPTYMVVKDTGLLNSLWALIIPVLFAPYNIIILKNFMSSLPLSKPALATISIWVAVAQWNGYMNALLYIQDKSKYILPLLVRDIVIGASDMANIEVSAMTNADVINAVTIVIATVPILIVYPFLQKYFTKGIMLGAVKG